MEEISSSLWISFCPCHSGMGIFTFILKAWVVTWTCVRKCSLPLIRPRFFYAPRQARKPAFQKQKGLKFFSVHSNKPPATSPLQLLFLLYKYHVKKIVWYRFFQKGQICFRGLAFFCIFVRNRIYVLEVKVLGPVVLARYNTVLEP